MKQNSPMLDTNMRQNVPLQMFVHTSEWLTLRSGKPEAYTGRKTKRLLVQSSVTQPSNGVWVS